MTHFLWPSDHTLTLLLFLSPCANEETDAERCIITCLCHVPCKWQSFDSKWTGMTPDDILLPLYSVMCYVVWWKLINSS